MKNIIVQKYGGTSVGDTDKIKRVADRIKSYYENGDGIVVVVSAMGHSTDHLVELAEKVNPNPSKREMDMLLSTGEQVSISLLAMALEAIGVPAQSFTGSQVQILTDGNYSNAKIEMIDRSKIDEALNLNKVVIVAGFQGIDKEHNITTLGRGGSDTSAVALAATLGAKECEIYTDVNGVYTADPNKVNGAKMHSRITYDEMLELASLGAGVLHSRSVELAKNYNVVIHVRSSFHREPGTLVVSEEMIMEHIRVSGVTLKNEEARVTIPDVPDKPGIAADLFWELANKDIIIDVIVQSSPANGKNTISFTMPRKNIKDALPILEKFRDTHSSGAIDINEKISIISAVGVGMKSHVGIAASMFKALAEKNINIEMISTSEIKISCVIPEEKAKEALTAVHDTFI
ncbi:MAG: aspartate kinase [Leptospiraceae bacterium]|nr:aspartate kinase [Leptospiraceae bacterium]MCP5511306.1 aspartate kinase [Leptospiraceae bacterium]